MHHKFCLVDNTTLITGTLDWGNDMSCDQWNYVYITNKPQLVEPVTKAFFTMWHYEQNNLLEITDSDTETKTCDSDNPADEPPNNDNEENPAKTEGIPEENSHDHSKNVTTTGDIDRNGVDAANSLGQSAVNENSMGHSTVTENNSAHSGDTKKIFGHPVVARKSADQDYARPNVPSPLQANNTNQNNYVNANKYNATQISNGEYLSKYAVHYISNKYNCKPSVMPGHPDFNKMLHEDFIASQKSTAF